MTTQTISRHCQVPPARGRSAQLITFALAWWLSTVSRTQSHLGDLINKTQISGPTPIQPAWTGARELTFLASSWLMLMLPVWGPPFENC